MKDLATIYDFVTSIKGTKNLFPQKQGNLHPSGMFSKFAQSIQGNMLKTDEEAMKFLYGNKKNYASYRKLKSRFKDRLLDFIFLNDTLRQIKSPYDKSLFQVQRTVLAAQILYMRDERSAAVALLKPALQTAMYYNHVLPTVNANRMLGMYAAYTGNKRDWSHYKNGWQKQWNLLTAETEMEMIYLNVVAAIFNITIYSPATRRLLLKSYLRGKEIYKRSKSHVITLNYYRLAISYYHSLGKFKKIITLSRQCIKYIHRHPQYYQRFRAGEFALIEMESCLHLQQFEAGKLCAQECLRHYTPGTSHWIVFNQYYFLLAMRTGNYSKALEIFYDVNPSNRHSKMPEIEKERWRIYEAYLNFTLSEELPKKQFNLFKFLNEVQLAERDRGGYRFSIFIAQIILLINIGDQDRLFDIAEPFCKYLQRHIRKKRHHRQYHFGKLMALLFKFNFDVKQVKNAEKLYLKMLLPSKINKLPLDETEIIPYPILWEMVLEKCRLYMQ